MPHVSNVMQRVADDPKFREHYVRAREIWADAVFEETLEIADDGSNDWITTEHGERVNWEHINRSRLRVDTRKWALGKMQPKKFGDKPQLDTKADVIINVIDHFRGD